MSRHPGAGSTYSGTADAVASTSTAHLSTTNVRHRQHDKDTINHHSSPSTRGNDASATERPIRRKRRGRNGATGSRSRGLRWRKGLVAEAFRQFGEHCARNQIRTLLIDCLVMTNLFYPSLALYLQKRFPPLRPPSQSTHTSHRIPIHGGQASPSRRFQKEHPLSLLSTPVLDSFFPYPPPLLPRLPWAGWWGRDTGQWNDEEWTVTRVPLDDYHQEVHSAAQGDGEVRIMRVAWADVEDVLDRDAEAEERSWEERDHVLLRLVRDMAEDWEQQYRSTGQRCIRQLEVSPGESKSRPTGPCYVLTPKSDISTNDVSLVPMSSISGSSGSNSTIPNQVTAGSVAYSGNVYHSFSVPFQMPQNTTVDFAKAWINQLTHVAKKLEGEIFLEARGSRSGTDDLTGEWIVSLSNASKVHSRFGLAFTGVVQLCCSSVMSFSVLALLGWNGWGASHSESSLPTYVLPFVIVVVGAENMSTLTKAIFSIPFTHSVPARIGLGLSKVGSTIALTSLTDLVVLGVVWLCVNLQPVREFCLFAAVVIITDWFMLHTFFLTVLSIDAQRLELADVLASNKVGPASPSTPDSEADAATEAKNGGFSWRNVLRARTTKSGSLILLLMTVGLLYWLTERHRSTYNTTATLYGYTPSTRTTSTSSLPSASPSPFLTDSSTFAQLSPAELLWRAINPQGWPFSRVVVPAASIIVLPKTGHSMLPADIRKLSLPASRLLLPRLRPLFYLFKVVILPQAVTAGALYILLLYLLKDADLLDAQRDRLGRGDDAHSDETDGGSCSTKSGTHILVNNLKAHMLPCSHESDIDIVASSSDGQVAITIGIDNTVCLWRFHELQVGSGIREPLQASALSLQDPIMAAAVSEDNRHVAVCTNGGKVQVWEISEEGPVASQPLRQITQLSSARIIGIAFDDTESIMEDPFTASRPSFDQAPCDPVVLIALSSGSVVASSTQCESLTVIPPQSIGGGPACRVSFLRVDNTLTIAIIGQHDFDVWRKLDSGWNSTHIASGLSKEDRVTAISDLNPDMPGLMALGHRSGCIDIYDEPHGTIVTVGQSTSVEGIRKVGLVRPPFVRCSGCGQQSSDGYLVVSSTPSQVFIDRIAPPSPLGTSFCRCARRGSSMEDSATSTMTPQSPYRVLTPAKGKLAALVVPPSSARKKYSPGSSPRKSPSLLTPISNGEFPLSSHGGARRLSNLHRDDESSLNTGTVNGGSTLKAGRSSPIDKSFPSSASNGSATSPGAEMDITPLGAVSSPDGGGWEVLTNDHVLIGIRRAGEGIDDGQWQCWLIDLTCPFNGSTLVVETMDLNEVISRTQRGGEEVSGRRGRPAGGDGGGIPVSISMRDRRTERLHSLNGRAIFPERIGSFSVPTYEPLGYVEIREMVRLGGSNGRVANGGGGGVIAGFGNRLGLITLSSSKEREKTIKARTSFEYQHPQLGLGSAPISRRTVFPLTPPPPPSRRVEMMNLGMSGIPSIGQDSGAKKID
ncbi:hypothetical protein CI109_100959 [Kwoniella shandongensis]|uniref:Sterol regulatory element-binding protein cleavage-activating protein n=1 Tax=Kwoniella shandongensis TaxID=1734106 RepID=A0AAJ8LEU4_9TREE